MPLSLDDLVLVRRKTAITSSIPSIAPSSARFSLALVSASLAILFLLSLVVYYTFRIFFNSPASSTDMEKERDPTLLQWYTADLLIGNHPQAMAYPHRRATRAEVEVISGHVHIPWFDSSYPVSSSSHSWRKRSWTLPISPPPMSSLDRVSMKTRTSRPSEYDYESTSKPEASAGRETLRIPIPTPRRVGPAEHPTAIQTISNGPPSPRRSPSPRRKPVPTITALDPIASPGLTAESRRGVPGPEANPNSASPSLLAFSRRRAATLSPPGDWVDFEPQLIAAAGGEGAGGTIGTSHRPTETKRRSSTIDSGSGEATKLSRARHRGRDEGRGRGRSRSKESQNVPLPFNLKTTLTTATEGETKPQPSPDIGLNLSLKVSRLVNLCAPRPTVNIDPTPRPRPQQHPGRNA